MSALAIGSVVFVCVFGGALLGMVLRSFLPDRHLSADSKDVVRLGMGLLATMAALVLSLLIASAKGSYDTQRNQVTQLTANVVLLDRVLAHYGPESKDSRDLLRRYVSYVLQQMWPTAGTPSTGLNLAGAGAEALY